MAALRRTEATRLAAALTCLTLAGACTSPGQRGATDPARTTVHVSPEGDDDDSGAQDAPLRSLQAALAAEATERVVIAAGSYSGALELSRAVELFGPGDGKATLNGPITVSADDVRVHGLVVQGGLAARGAQRLTVSASRLEAGEAAEALRLDASSGTLEDLELLGGAEAAAWIEGSTVTAARLSLTAATRGKRGLRVVGSSVAADALKVTGSEIMAVQVEKNGRLVVRGLEVAGHQGSGVGVLSDGQLISTDLRVGATKDIPLLASRGTVDVKGGRLGPSQGVGIGVQAASATLSDVVVESAVQGVVSMSALRGASGTLTLDRATLKLGDGVGVIVGDGALTMRDSRIEADRSATTENEAVVINGQRSTADLERVTIADAGDWAVSINDAARVKISGTIQSARVGGVRITEGAGSDVDLVDLIIQGCGTGSGIAAFDATELSLDRVEIGGCPEAGLIAGEGSQVEVRSSILRDNQTYGVAAFGGSRVELTGTEIRGASWAAFAACSDGSEIIDRGDNVLDGPTTLCR